jgi:hypothetical protein
LSPAFQGSRGLPSVQSAMASQRGLSSYVSSMPVGANQTPQAYMAQVSQRGGVAGLTPEQKEAMIKQMQMQLQYKQMQGGVPAGAGAPGVPSVAQLSAALSTAYSSYGSAPGSVAGADQLFQLPSGQQMQGQPVVSGSLIPQSQGMSGYQQQQPVPQQGYQRAGAAARVRPRSAYDEYLEESKRRWKEANRDKPYDMKEIRKTAKATFSVLTFEVRQIFEARAVTWNQQKAAAGVEIGPPTKKYNTPARSPSPYAAMAGPGSNFPAGGTYARPAEEQEAPCPPHALPPSRPPPALASQALEGPMALLRCPCQYDPVKMILLRCHC